MYDITSPSYNVLSQEEYARLDAEREREEQDDYEDEDDDCVDSDEDEERDEDDLEEQEKNEPENGEKTAVIDPLKRSDNGTFAAGNPGGPGRPKKPKSLKTLLRRALFAKNDDVAAHVLTALYRKALEGNVSAIRLILDHSKPDKELR